MVEEVTNPANKPMHYGDKPVITTVQAPNTLPKRVIYSGIEARRQYEQMEHDIYDGIRKSKKLEKKKFPAVLKWLFGGIAITAGIFFRKNITKFVKNIFK